VSVLPPLIAGVPMFGEKNMLSSTVFFGYLLCQQVVIGKIIASWILGNVKK
jgi:hypothetical protein